MAKKKPTKTAKRKQNLLRQVRRMENSGKYWFEFDIKSEIKNLSPQKAVWYTTDKLFEKAKGVDVETGEVLSGTEVRKLERSRKAKKAAQTRRRKKESEISIPVLPEIEEPEQEPEEEPYDITQEVIGNFRELLDFFARPLPDQGTALDGKTVPKYDTLGRYGVSVKTYIERIFEEERRKDEGALANRLYDNSDKIDELIGVIEYAMYKENVRIAGNQLIKIIRGTATLSDKDRKESENIANEDWSKNE